MIPICQFDISSSDLFIINVIYLIKNLLILLVDYHILFEFNCNFVRFLLTFLRHEAVVSVCGFSYQIVIEKRTTNEMNEYDSDCLELRKNFNKHGTLFDSHLNVNEVSQSI